MKINKKVIEAWLDSLAKKQTDNVRFIPAIVTVKPIKNGMLELTLSSDSDLVTSDSVVFSVGDKVTIPDVFVRISMEDI